jgi:phospholipid/cholesterol/gamma-HCH transport system substrate-binding protein
MENKSHALAAGAFVLVVAGLLVALALWLTRDTTERRVFELSSREGVTGLQPQAGVRYKGVLVGRVTSIALDREVTGNVLVRIAVGEDTPITKSTYASLGFQGVTGLAFIQLEDGGESLEQLVSIQGRPPRIPLRAGLFTRLTEQGASLVKQLDDASHRLNALLATPNQKALMQTIGNMGQAAQSIQQLAHNMDEKLPALVSNVDATFTSMRATSQRMGDSAEAVRASSDAFKRMSQRMAEPGGTLDKIAQGSQALVNSSQNLNTALVPRLNRTADEAARTARQLGRTAEVLQDNPQSLLWGSGAPAPGPGEPGFVAPSAP